MNVLININGREMEVPAHINVIEACARANVEVPHFCYHSELSISGSCRMCLVSVGTPARDRTTGKQILNSDGRPKIAFMPKPAIACGTTVCEGMHIITDSNEIRQAREGVMEFLLANHPLDCPICDKAGECKLQELSAGFGNGRTRFIEDKNVKPKKVKIGGGKIILDAERCILCSRCIRFCNEKIGREILGFTKRGSKTEIDAFDRGDDGSNYFVNVSDICPVGALTEAAFRFKMRTWFLRATNYISAESSAGVNVRVWSRENKIYRITPRKNPHVNDSWMPDSGRLEYKRVEYGARSSMRVDGAPCNPSYAIARAQETLSLENIAIVASAYQTLEEQFLVAELARMCGAKIYAVSHLSDDDGRLVSADRTPNMRGLFMAGIVSEYPKPDLKELSEEIRAGRVKNVLCFEENIIKLGVEERDFKLANVIYCGVADNETAKHAKVSIAMESNFEKSGMFVNRQFRLQGFERAVKAPENVLSQTDTLIKLINTLGNTSYSIPHLSDIRRAMCRHCDILPDECIVAENGVQLDSSKYASINFPEKEGLHFTKNG